jgi:hypothetical protein
MHLCPAAVVGKWCLEQEVFHGQAHCLLTSKRSSHQGVQSQIFICLVTVSSCSCNTEQTLTIWHDNTVVLGSHITLYSFTSHSSPVKFTINKGQRHIQWP